MLNVPDRIKELLHTDSVNKNIRIHFPNGERSDICNNQIVKDSVEFKESLCSQKTLKFGLCEAPIFQCRVFGVGNITGAVIEVDCEIFCESTVEDAVWQPDIEHWVYQIPYGTFIVESAKRQADMMFRTIVAYGGTSLLAPDNNEILKAKASVPFTQQTNYAPKVLDTAMMFSRSVKQVSAFTYSEVSTSLVEIIVKYVPNVFDGPRWLSLKCVAIELTNSNHDNLYFCDFTKALKDIDQIKSEMNAEPDDYYFREIEKQTFWGAGVNGSQTYQAESTTILGDILLQDGKYIYPYQIKETYGIPVASYVYIPYGFVKYKQSVGEYTPSIIAECEFRDPALQKIYTVDTSIYGNYRYKIARDRIIKGDAIDSQSTYYVYDNKKIDYIELLRSTVELMGLFFNINRNGMVELINIKRLFELLPSNTLYPSNALYPESSRGGQLYPDDYQSCWYDDDYIQTYELVRCTYKDTNNRDYTYYLHFDGVSQERNINTLKTYEITNNAIIDANTWEIAQMRAICRSIRANLTNVTYMPVEFVGRGLPYVEAGDTFEILTKSNDSITTIVLNRTIKGEQHLVDSYKSV